jgi:hypothetical protein
MREQEKVASAGADQAKGKENSKNERVMSDVKKYAERYFKNNYEPVTGAKNISKVSVKISELRLVDGWDKRWFVRGTCEIQSRDVVQVYPYYSPKVIRSAARQGETIEADYSPQDVAKYTTQTRNFEAYYSTESATPTFDVTLK